MSDFAKDIGPDRRGRKLAEGEAPSVPPSLTTPAAAPDASGRDRLGRFQLQHRLNISTGSDTDRLPPGLEHLRAEMDRFVAGSLTDEGEQQDIPTRRRSLLEYRARVHRRILQLDAVLDQRGLVDKRGKLRVAWLSQLQTLIAAAVRIDNLLGLDRRPKAALDLESYIAQQQAENNNNSERDAQPPDQGGTPHDPLGSDHQETAQTRDSESETD